jgi:hypothetical protein
MSKRGRQYTFRDDMAAVIERLKYNARRGRSPHPYVKCQILLVQFMTDVIAESGDKEVLENLDVFEEKCEYNEDLVRAFSRWVCYLEPQILERLGCDYRQTVIKTTIENWSGFSTERTSEIRPLYFSVFVLDLIVRESTLSDDMKNEWSTRVLMNWLENMEGPATNVLERAEAFFEKLEPAVADSLVDSLVRNLGPRVRTRAAFTGARVINPYAVFATTPRA